MTQWKPPGYEQHAMVRAFGDFRYRFYPAGTKPEDVNNLVYVKHKSAKQSRFDQDVRIVSAASEYVHFDLPDRELLFTSSAVTVDGDRPFNDPVTGKGWDKAVSMSPFLSSGDDFPYDRILINPHTFPSERVEPKTRAAESIYNPDKVIIADSGGFQLGHGSMNFIHPDSVINFYNRNADEGIVLDIPARALANEDILHHTARVQNLNTTYMKKRLPKDFRLATVFHGQRLHMMDQFRRDIETHDADFAIACLPGTQRLNLLEAVHKTMYAVSTGEQYPQYHLLGVANPPLVVALIRLAYLFKQSGRDVLLTSDSSSPIGFSLKHTYYGQPAFYNALTPTRYGEKYSSNKEAPAGAVLNVHRRIASTDPFTQLLGGYQDVIAAYNIHVTRTYAMYVNQFELVRYINQMCVYADKLNHKEYKELVNLQFKGSMHAHILAVTLDYMREAFDSGLEKAFERYKSYMPYFTGETTLHQFPAIGEDESADDHETDMKRKRLIKVIKNYLVFHKTGRVPAEFRNKENTIAKGTNLTLKI